MSCKITTGLAFNCEDRVNVGGVSPVFWVGYLSELDTPFSTAMTADISQIDFGSYGGLRRFEGDKYWHQASSEFTKSQGAGSVSWKHTFIAKLIADSTSDDSALRTLSLGNDIFIVYQDNNQKFYILGAGAGLSVETDPQTTGQTGDADTTHTVTLVGAERTPPLRFSLGSGATLAYLVSREI